MSFKYEVIVAQPPTVEEAPPRLIIVPQGNQAQVTTVFGGSLTSRVGFLFLFKNCSVCSLENGLQDAFPYVADLNPEIEFPSDSSLRYTVRDLAFASNSPYGSSHTVTMVATNALGTVRTDTLIRVLRTLSSRPLIYCSNLTS